MKGFKMNCLSGLLSVVLLFGTTSCEKDENNSVIINSLSKTEENALIFMIEEEKLALDTYTYLGELWGINQFLNIQKSEQSHVNEVSNLIEQYDLTYTMLPEGEFMNEELQGLYNQFVVDGSKSQLNALLIGATIEDLDIVDLEDLMQSISNGDILNVFESLQCGSRNHLRAFVSAINQMRDNYTPQYLSMEEYIIIIESSNERCN
ncbi:DUF2202 domain-containing protein [Maribacter sp. PR1]|uniref:DUF2202 domain-containing protein n=1 Tax=Maribacter cobaltidurans TaxID=1178778 RepID=A0ABU7IUQ5_9FLAO|nr:MULTISPECIES: DUF2202 domain-containing protein [Maribacter]MDC6389313.1 DUF2202 domain-containing protein [Maribacter sp. PR1]MEE1976701.1 DUF2202 domain-containing protein [Maribacter cobaltidurans]